MQYFIQILINGISLGALYAMVALGVALVFGVMRMINFAHGGFIMIGGYVVYLLAGGPLALWTAAAVLGVTAIAILAERIAFRPFRKADGTTLLVASFALNTIIQAIAQMISGSVPYSPALPSFLSSFVGIAGISISSLSLITVSVAVIVVGALVLFFRRTPVGVQMRAAAENFQMARLVGVNANRVISLAFAISGGLAGISAILLIAQSGSVSPSFGFQPVIIGFVAVVIGGMGSLPGAALGGIIIGLGTTLLQGFLPEEAMGYRDAFVFAGVILLLLFLPRGVFGTKERRA
ncbi:MAG: branched-chain amino acid ABC transporter permease [Microbacterium sp.]